MEIALDKILEIGGGVGALALVLILAARKVYSDLRKDLVAERTARETQGTAFLAMFSELTADANTQLKSLEMTIRDQTSSNSALKDSVKDAISEMRGRK